MPTIELETAARTRQRGFSLIELTVALAIGGVFTIGLMLWLARPLQALIESHSRSAAVDDAERVFSLLSAELADALPNSVRIACGGRCLEFLPVAHYGDYRLAVPGDRLDFGTADDGFDVLMPLSASPLPGMQLVINNLNAASSGSLSAYSVDADSNRSTVAPGTTAAQIRFAAKQFPAPSSTQRFFIVDGPVSYLCDPAPAGRTMRRLSGYAIQASQPTDPGAGDLLAGNVLGCRFELLDGKLAALRLETGSESASAVTMFTQVRLVHAP